MSIEDDKTGTALATVEETSIDYYNDPFEGCCDDVSEKFNVACDDRSSNKYKKNNRKPPPFGKERFQIFFNEYSQYGNMITAIKKSGLSRGWIVRHAEICPEFKKRMEVGTRQAKDRVDLMMWKLALGEAKKVKEGYQQNIHCLIELTKILNPAIYSTSGTQDNRTQININLNDLIKKADKIWDEN